MKNKKIIFIIFILIICIILFVIFGLDKREKELFIEKDKYSQIYLYDLGKSKIEVIIKDDFIFLINSGLEAEKDELLDCLDRLGIEEIDYFIITNKDDKYVGNALFILEHFKVDFIYFNDYEYNSKYIDDLYEFLDSSYTERIILTSNENIKISDLKVDIFPFMSDKFNMIDKSLIVSINEGNNYIYLTNNVSSKRIETLNKSTLLVGENINIFDYKSKYYIYDGKEKIKRKSNILKRNINIYMNSDEFIIE